MYVVVQYFSNYFLVIITCKSVGVNNQLLHILTKCFPFHIPLTSFENLYTDFLVGQFSHLESRKGKNSIHFTEMLWNCKYPEALRTVPRSLLKLNKY